MLIQDTATLDSYGIPTKLAGKQVTIKSFDVGNNCAYFTCLDFATSLAGQPQHFRFINDNKQKPTKFSRKDVEDFAKQGSNARLATELTIRINAARNELAKAASPAEFRKTINAVNEQIRQAKLIHAAIKQ